jgi:hypothetical protein
LDSRFKVQGRIDKMLKKILLINADYAADELGNIHSLRYNRILKPGLTRKKHGYHQVAIPVNGKGISSLVHKLVWEAFNGLVPEGLEIDHIDRCYTNNKISNLRVVNRSQNMKNTSRSDLKTSKAVEKELQMIDKYEQSIKLVRLNLNKDMFKIWIEARAKMMPEVLIQKYLSDLVTQD